MIVASAAFRWLHFFALMVLFGASAFEWLRRRNAMGPIDVRRILITASLIAAFTALAQLLTTTIALNGGLGPAPLANLLAVIRDTRFGHLFLIRSAALAGLMAVASLRTPPLAVTAFLAAIALGAIAGTSHSAASGLESFALFRAATDTVHLLTGGFWLGGLVALLQIVRERSAIKESVALFSDVAIYAVTFLAMTGAVDACFIIAAERVSWTYAVLLLAKISLAVAMIAIAFINRLRVMPMLATNEGTGILESNVRAEMVLGLVVVAIASVLGSISPG